MKKSSARSGTTYHCSVVQSRRPIRDCLADSVMALPPRGAPSSGTVSRGSRHRTRVRSASGRPSPEGCCPAVKTETSGCGSDELHELLAQILAAEKADEGAWRALEALRDGLAVLQPALGDECSQLRERLRPDPHVLGDDEPLHPQAVRQDGADV